MQKFLLVDDYYGGLDILATTYVNCKDAAANYFFVYQGWVIGEIMSETEFLALAQSESQLNALENQSSEC